MSVNEMLDNEASLDVFSTIVKGRTNTDDTAPPASTA